MKKMKLFMAAAVTMLMSFALLFTSIVAKTSIIINMGIKAYRVIAGFLIAGCVIGCILLIVLVALAMKAVREDREDMDSFVDDKSMTEDDREALYVRLREFNFGKWGDVTGINALVTQLNDMNEYQGNLQFLLDQTTYLKEQPAVIIQRVEDAMYLNVKKLINYMQVLQRKDVALLEQKVSECSGKNEELLHKAKDFVVAVVDYVNKDMSPGEDQNAVDHVNSYMYIVLDAIGKEEFYLS